MTGSREDSPDWLRSYQPPTFSAIALSSGSESPLSDSPQRDEEDEVILSKLFKKEDKQVPHIKDGDDDEPLVSQPAKGKSPKKTEKSKLTPGRKRKSKDDSEKQGKASKRRTSDKPAQSQEQNHAILTLSSDSESQDANPVRMTDRHPSARDEGDTENKRDIDDIVLDNNGKSPIDDLCKVKSPRNQLSKEGVKLLEKKNTNEKINGENNGDVDVVKEDITEMRPEPPVSSSSRLPLMLSDKVQRSKILIECEGDSIDLSGDMGAVGRIVISDGPSTKPEMLLDLKGTIYKTTIVPSRTFCVVSFGQSEAKIEAIMNDFIQLKPQSNVYEAETMVEGTLDGFSFDSEDEADNLPKGTAQADQDAAVEEQSTGKAKRKTEKSSGSAAQKGKAVGGKPPKKVKKKPPVSKKTKTKK